MTGTEADDAFFNAVWKSPDELVQWGFLYFSQLPMLVPGEGLYSDTPASVDPFFDRGSAGGYWRHHEGAAAPPYYFSVSYTMEQKFEICSGSAESFLQYCRRGESDLSGSRRAVEGYISRQWRYSPEDSNYQLGIRRSVSEFYEKANACVRAYGGCDGILDRRAQWDQYRGRNSFE